MKIATEEAFVTPAIAREWRRLLEDGSQNEPGFASLIGFFLDDNERARNTIGWLSDLGETRLAHMDEGGVDMQVIFLTAPGIQVFDADTAMALAIESNDVLIEAVRNHPTRFAGLAAVAPHAPISSAKELERAVGLGLKGAVVNSHTKGEYLDNLTCRPLLEAAAALDVPIYIHPRTPSPRMAAPFLERHIDRSLSGFQTETAMNAMRMMVAGVFDELPNLRIVLGHLGEAIPFWLDRMDRHYPRHQSAPERYPNMRGKRLPSEYFAENFYSTTSGHNWDPAVRFVEEVVGEDRLMFAVDYPYESCKQQVDQAAEIKVKNPEKFYSGVAKKVFKLD